jgi:hypothetical protein
MANLTMSQQPAARIFAVIAVSATLGAAQFASGHDLSGPQRPAATQPAAGTSEVAINRAAKADRAAGVAGPAAQTRTISLRLQGISDTSVLVRIPDVQEARSRSSVPPVMKSDGRKVAVACEPMVSILTEIAKQLQPGRCVT